MKSCLENFPFRSLGNSKVYVQEKKHAIIVMLVVGFYQVFEELAHNMFVL